MECREEIDQLQTDVAELEKLKSRQALFSLRIFELCSCEKRLIDLVPLLFSQTGLRMNENLP